MEEYQGKFHETEGRYDSSSINPSSKVERVNEPSYSAGPRGEGTSSRGQAQTTGNQFTGTGFTNPAYQNPAYSSQSNPSGKYYYSNQQSQPNYGQTNPNSASSNMYMNQAPKQRAPKTPKKGGFGKTALKTVAVALIFGLVGGTAFEGVHLGASRLTASTTESATVATVAEKSDNVKTASGSSDSSSSSTLDYDVSDIVKSAESSIVSITTKVTTNYQYFFQNYEQESTGAGSGIIIAKTDDVLYIATNYHVVSGAKEINVGFNDGEMVTASTLGYDEDRDIAVVAVDFSDMKASTTDAISIAAIGDSNALQVGEPAVAIGNALGYGQSVTVGYISALNRSIEGSEGTFIQTDAAINPGNSGGALINSKGEVIGINSIKYADTQVEGMGFSIPINTAMKIIDNIISGKQQDGSLYLGISSASISKDYAQIYGFPEGVYVKDVTKGSPAEKAGLHTGDIIVSFDGTDTLTVEELQNAIADKNAGDQVTLGVYRADAMGNYAQEKIKVTLENKANAITSDQDKSEGQDEGNASVENSSNDNSSNENSAEDNSDD